MKNMILITFCVILWSVLKRTWSILVKTWSVSWNKSDWAEYNIASIKLPGWTLVRNLGAPKWRTQPVFLDSWIRFSSLPRIGKRHAFLYTVICSLVQTIAIAESEAFGPQILMGWRLLSETFGLRRGVGRFKTGRFSSVWILKFHYVLKVQKQYNFEYSIINKNNKL